VYGGLAGYFYFRRERSNDTPRVPVAMVGFAAQYGLVFTIAVLGRYALLPTILLFLTIIALVTVIRLGLQAHSKAGFRIALAVLFTLVRRVHLQNGDRVPSVCEILSLMIRWDCCNIAHINYAQIPRREFVCVKLALLTAVSQNLCGEL
jgi:hypothetical protein